MPNAVIVPIGSLWRITADPHGYALERRQSLARTQEARTPAHAPREWRPVAWYSTPTEAVRGLWRREARTISADSVAFLGHAYEQASRRLERSVRDLIGSP